MKVLLLVSDWRRAYLRQVKEDRGRCGESLKVACAVGPLSRQLRVESLASLAASSYRAHLRRAHMTSHLNLLAKPLNHN